MPYPFRPSLLAPRPERASPFFERSITALERYLGLRPGPLRFTCVEGGLSDVAKMAAEVRYPGHDYADAEVSLPDDPLGDDEVPGVRLAPRAFVLCADRAAETALSGRVPIPPSSCYAPLDLLYDPERGAFHAPTLRRDGLSAALALLRSGGDLVAARAADPSLALFELAGLLSRVPFRSYPLPALPGLLSASYQRDLLTLVLAGPDPARAFEMLARVGFLDAYWPEIAQLQEVDHSKDFHPEGDGWRHTMETFSHRKRPDPLLSLALLLHDSGKPEASERAGKRFDGHAEIGSSLAARFLTRLEFPPEIVRAVRFLVRNHMLPAAIPRIPPFAIERVLSDPLMPVLLELYRCDELSTFRGPEGYYLACAAYREFVRSSRKGERNARAPGGRG
jgi:poly(A) polymerase